MFKINCSLLFNFLCVFVCVTGSIVGNTTLTNIPKFLTVEPLTSESGIIFIKNAPIRLIDSYVRIYHNVNITKYEEFLTLVKQNRGNISSTDIETTIDKIEAELAMLRRHMDMQINEKLTLEEFNTSFNINTKFTEATTIRKRRAVTSDQTLLRKRRGVINMVGSMYNWLFGVMDDNDRQEIIGHLDTIDKNIHNTIEGHNDQIRINNVYASNFQKIEKTFQENLHFMNNIEKNNIKLSNSIIENKITRILNKLEDEIEKIVDNINAAKENLMARSILSTLEIKENHLSLDQLRHINTAVLTRGDIIVFVISIPIYSTTLYNSYLVRQIPNKLNETLEVNGNEVVRYKNGFYLKELHRNKLKTRFGCLRRNCIKAIDGNFFLEEVKNGVLLLININGMLEHNCNERQFNLKGHYLINFRNCIITVNNLSYSNVIQQYHETLVVEPIFELNSYTRQITPEQLHLEQVKNIKRIEELHYQHKYTMWGAGCGFLVLTVILIFLIILYCYCRKTNTTNVKVNFKKIPTTEPVKRRSVIENNYIGDA